MFTQRNSMRRKRVWVAGIATTLVVPLLIVMPSGPAFAASTTLNIVTQEPSTGFDPAIAKTQASLRVMELIYDTLVDYDSNGNIVGDIAESWKTSSNGLTITFQLRSNAKFSDGSAITPVDVKFSIDRAAASGTMKEAYANMQSISESGSSAVVIKLNQKSRRFMDTLATIGNSGILSKKAVSGNASYFLSPTATSGPWKLTSNIPQNRAKLDANSYYWKTGYPKIQTINYVYSSDGTANASALEAGTQDMSFPMNPMDAIRLKKAGKLNYALAEGPTELFWGFNKTISPFNDIRVRTALAYLVPRQEKQDVCWEGIGPVSYGNIIHTGFFAQPDLTKFKVPRATAIRKANTLLTQAGWVVSGGSAIRVAKGVDGVKDGTKLSFKVPFESTWAQARCHTEMMSQFVKAAGVEALPQAADKATFWTEVSKGSFGMYHGGNGYPTIDAQMLNGYTCQGGLIGLIAKWCNKDFDALVDQALISPAFIAKTLYKRAERIVNEQLPLIMVGGQYNVIGYNPNLKGFVGRFDSSNRGLIVASMS